MTTGKVLKERRAPRERGRTGSSLTASAHAEPQRVEEFARLLVHVFQRRALEEFLREDGVHVVAERLVRDGKHRVRRRVRARERRVGSRVKVEPGDGQRRGELIERRRAAGGRDETRRDAAGQSAVVREGRGGVRARRDGRRGGAGGGGARGRRGRDGRGRSPRRDDDGRTRLRLRDASSPELVVVREEVLDADPVLVHAIFDLRG